MKNVKVVFLIGFLGTLILAVHSCTKEKEQITNCSTGYPDNIASIMITKCATAGCHNTQSKEGASGLDLSTYANMFNGNVSGAVVIPYNSDMSTIFTFCNTDASLGLNTQLPKMPYNQAALSHDELVTLKNWINNGAPDCHGNVMFSTDPNRKKLVICDQGCDQVHVFDRNSKTCMRINNVGLIPGFTEGPHQIKYTPDGKYYIVAFYSGIVVQRYDAATDALVDQVTVGAGTWGTLAISPDSKTAFTSDWEFNGKICQLDLTQFPMTAAFTFPTFDLPHGLVVSPDGTYLYVTSTDGNMYYKGHITSSVGSLNSALELFMDNSSFPNSTLQGHDIAFSPDGTKYYITCQLSSEVRAFNYANDSLIATISVGTPGVFGGASGSYPQELAFSKNTPYLFVSVMLDNYQLGSQGSVAIINYQSNTFINKKIFTGIQPHGIAVDDDAGIVYVVNRNSNGFSHHVTACGGTNGYLTLIDVSSSNPYNFSLVPNYKYELSVNPYFVSLRPNTF